MKSAVLASAALAVGISAAAAELYEDFHAAPGLSEGWAFGLCTNVVLDSFSGENNQFFDKVTSAPNERTSLKIARPVKLTEGSSPSLEVVSPLLQENVRRCSFYCKRVNGDACSDRICVYGRGGEAAEWKPLGEPTEVSNKNQWVTNAVPDSLGIRQVKFSFSADLSTTTFLNCALDSLRVLTGEDLPSGGDEPAAPTKPTKLKLAATAPDEISATWDGVPGADGYRVDLFRVDDGRETEVPDFSGLKDGLWPTGWTHSDAAGLGAYVDGKTSNVKFSYADAWIASPAYARPVTSFSCKFRSRSSKAGEVGRTTLVVETSSTESGGDWIELKRLSIASTMTTVTHELEAEAGVRRVRFSVSYTGDDRQYGNGLSLEFRVLSVTCGQAEKSLVTSSVVPEPQTVFSGLDATASYVVTVCPAPSDDPELAATSDALDLSGEHFRKTGALPVTLRNLTYEERFDSLSNFVTQTKTAKINLDYWQFVMDGAEMEALGLSHTNATPQRAGVYVCRDKEGVIADVETAMLGTLASGDHECAVGLALRNETGGTLMGPAVVFDAIQRSFANAATSYFFEYRVTDGETSVAAGDGWAQFEIPATAPYTAGTKGDRAEYRQIGIGATVPAKIPNGGVLLLRWRHPEVTSGPMMAIDNVRVEFASSRGFRLIVR